MNILRWFRFPSPRRALTDLAILVVVATANVALATLSPYWVPGSTHSWPELTLETLLIGVLLLRYRAPLTMAVILVAAVTAALLWHQLVLGGPYPLSTSTDLWVAIVLPNAVAVTVETDHRRRWVVWVLLGVATVVAVQPWSAFSWATLTNGVAMVAFPALVGLYIGVRHRLRAARERLIQALEERAERAEREQHLLAEQARAEERAKLAAEMHDVVSHRISLMVLQAGALRTVAGDEATRAAAEELRAGGAQALEELRDLVGVLRTSPPATGDGDEPARTTLPDLSSLAAESESVGVPVELRTDGNPTLTSPVVARTAYQVVREALTNVRKHAPGAPVRVHVRYGADRVRLTIRNRPPARPPDPGLATSGSGSGLYGLRQRVELVGGTLETGPAADGGFQVDAVLPAYVPTARQGSDDTG